MAVHTLSSDTLERTLESHDIVVIDFWASWCGPCQSFKPIFEAASEQHAGVHFASCNTEEEPGLAAMFQIQSIPTVVVFRDQIPVFGQPGMLPGAALEDLLEKVKALDMDDVRRRFDAQRHAATA